MEWKFKHYDINSGVDWDSIGELSWYSEMEAIPQDEIWHGEGNVQIHTKMVVEALIGLPEFQELNEQDKHIMVVSALMHDIEKRSVTTTEEIDGKVRIVAPRHAQRGERTARTILYKEYATPFHIREEICALVRYHGVPLWGIDTFGWERNVVRTSLRLRNDLLGMLSKADVLGRICPDQEELLYHIGIFEICCMQMECYFKPREFKSGLGRLHYLTTQEYIDINPYDDAKFEVVMLSGIAGSGKDTLIKRKYESHPMISLDGIRREMKVKPLDKKGNGRVYQEAKERCKIEMRNKTNFIFNATNITKDMRSKWINLFEEYGGKVVIEYVEVPYKTLINQNHNRDYKVPEKVIDKMVGKLEIPTYEEVYDINYNVKF